MRYLNEFRDPEVASGLLKQIRELAERIEGAQFMEVCGTHTMSLHRFGIKAAMPENITLLSGPGCPVCVTPNEYIDKAVAYAKMPDTVITTFGDMIRVPGTSTSLERIKSEGPDIRIVYSTLDALKIAEAAPDKNVIFLGVGFETTAPTIAASIIKAREKNIGNYSVFCAHKVMPPALETLSEDPELNIDGFICPAHVSTVIGLEPYGRSLKNTASAVSSPDLNRWTCSAVLPCSLNRRYRINLPLKTNTAARSGRKATGKFRSCLRRYLNRLTRNGGV